MKKILWVGALAVALLVASQPAQAEHHQKVIAGKPFDKGFVQDFYLEGNAIPTQKRNGAMLQFTEAKRAVFGLLDTSGYSAEIQAKYIGMLLTETKLMLGDSELPVGAYGFGLHKADPPEGPAKLKVHDIAGDKVVKTEAQYDADLAQPVPLQIVIEEGKPTRLYLGRHFVELK